MSELIEHHLPHTELTAPPEPAGNNTASLLSFVAMAVKDPNIDVAKLEALLRMQREIVADDARTQFNQAMTRLQGKLPRIKKNGTIEFKDKGQGKAALRYARWEDIDAAIRPVLNEEGFVLSFNTRTRPDGGVIVTGRLLHVAGHFEEAEMALPIDTSGGKSNLQGYASSTSFGSRYTAKMLLNLVFEGEDDGGVRGGMTFITPEQVKEIGKGLLETKSDLNAFLDFMEVASVEGIQARDFQKAVGAIATKRRKMAEVAKEPAAAKSGGGGDDYP